ncbi:MAG: methyltransferase domain-containing protein [Oleiphilaceae bacterium]|nr:methyltransferase domain-containing protein [Oleiphilaceae bacterium]
MVDVYTQHARRFFDQYQTLGFEDVHAEWLQHLPDHPGFILDVGAGSGRDAAAMASRGWDVLAVEPAKGLRELGEQATQGTRVQWLDDQLPELDKVRSQATRFNLILVSAVWMHLPPSDREKAFRTLTELLTPGGILVVTLRHGPDDGERIFYEVDRQELEAWARSHALVGLEAGRDEDKLGRSDVWWETVVFQLKEKRA